MVLTRESFDEGILILCSAFNISLSYARAIGIYERIGYLKSSEFLGVIDRIITSTPFLDHNVNLIPLILEMARDVYGAELDIIQRED